MATVLENITAAIKTGNRTQAVAGTEEALKQGVKPDVILGALIAGMDDVGVRFKGGQAFVPEVLIAARAMNESMAKLAPALVAAGHKPVATAIIGTVQGDLHDIGKNLVAMMLKGANIEVIDLGVNVPAAKFVAAAQQHKPAIIALSALLTTTMPAMKGAIDALKGAGVTANIMIGGAPVTQEYANEIGAHGYAPDAASAVDCARKMLA
jgi:5-methyltetrahydrofolate--homocysteine methyltransferase